jgi:predicted amidophosphoribosyltransferase
MPIILNGMWGEGYATDYHTVSSEPIGVDGYGHIQYQTVRTELGELVYRYKYKNNYDCLEEIIELTEPFIRQWLKHKNITSVLPVPPSNKRRLIQPVFEIAKEIADILGAGYNENVLLKSSLTQSKNLNALEKEKIESTITKMKVAKKRQNILLVDDLYQSGATLNECVKILKKDQNIAKIYVLTMTKTKR